MNNCELVTFMTILACKIANGKTQEELAVLAAFFTQLRRYIDNYWYFKFE